MGSSEQSQAKACGYIYGDIEMLTEIIRMFKEEDGFVSGEEMSRRLGITRAAIWKKIEALRNKGFRIEGSPAKGYRLVRSPEFSVDELRTLIPPRPPLGKGGWGDFIGREIIFHERTDSTNVMAMKLAENGAGNGTVVIADSQSKGKGRLGRTWTSPSGMNVYMSIILRPEIEPKDATLLTIMSAVACARAIRNISGLHVGIKWPNDLMASDKKIGGILTEMKSDPDRIIFAVIGIGINVNMNQKDFPSEIKPIATSIREELNNPPSPPFGKGGMGGFGKGEISRTHIIAGILNEMDRWYGILRKKGKTPLLDEWREFSSTLGRKVRVSAGSQTFTGIAEDIDDEGMLLVRLSSGGLKKISAGDVMLLR
ncbi:MAG: biotin--[acetyl-CoA-carboxylase] ligase [Nitrospirae bacterium]|nr:biotin--[acetyl-CoA-carboxylase] ligase [Nitrospirota bacterium]